MATVASNAMLEDEITELLCPHRHEHYHHYRARVLTRAKRRIWAGNTMLVMVTDSDDSDWNGVERIISGMAMKRSGSERRGLPFWDALNLTLALLEALYDYCLRIDKSVDYAKLDAFSETLRNPGPLAVYKKNWEIVHLSVDNNFQRRGIGQQMIKRAQSIASEDQLPLVLLASVKGTGLYTKCGFKQVGVVQFGDVAAPAMVWTPETDC